MSLRTFVKANFDTMTSDERMRWLSVFQIIRVSQVAAITIISVTGIIAYDNYLVPSEVDDKTPALKASHREDMVEAEMDCEKRIRAEIERGQECTFKLDELNEAINR